MLVKKLIETFELNFNRADKYIAQISTFDISGELFNDIEKIKTIDGFIYRFSKIQDMMGDKLFPVYLESVQEYKNSLTLLDMLNKLERLDIIRSAEEWKFFRRLRNLLTHEYPDNEDELLEGIKEAFSAYEKIKSVYEKIKKEIV